MKDRFIVGFDLGGTKMMACLFDEAFNVVARKRRSAKGHDGPDKGMERIIAAIEDVLESGDVGPEQLAGIGIGCPGVVNLKTGMLRRAPNLGWHEVPVGRILTSHFGAPAHTLNDVDAGAYGEYSLGAGKGAYTMVAVNPGTGVGGGAILNGQLLTGKNASCMELGHTRIQSAHLTGAVDDLPVMEALCSRLGIASHAIVEAYKGNAPTLFKEAGTDLQAVKSGAIARAIAAGDTAVEQIVRSAIHYLSISVAGVVDLLGPDVIVLGGGLVEKMPELYLDGVRRGIDRFASPALAEEVEIREAKLGDDSVALGAAAFAAARAEEENA